MLTAFIAMAAPQQGGAGGGGFVAFLPMILIIVIMYFLILRPQMKRQKEHQLMLTKVTKGDRIVTSGGLHGTILKVNEKDNTLTINAGDSVKVVVDRAAVARKVDPVKEASGKAKN